MEVDKVRLAELYAALAEKLKGNVVDVNIVNGKAVFEIEMVKSHIAYTEYVELPIMDWFLERYCFDLNK